MLASLAQAWRSWRHAKAVAALAIVALAVGIGAATAIFSVVDGVLMRPVPWDHPDRYVALFEARTNEKGWNGFSYPDIRDFEERAHSFESVGPYLQVNFSLTSPGVPRHVLGIKVSPAFMRVLGVPLIRGRWFGDGKSESGNTRLAVISHSLWQRLGGRPDLIGRALTLDGTDYIITGVAPAGFRFPLSNLGGVGTQKPADIWIVLDRRTYEKNRDVGAFLAYAKLKPGISLAQADAEMKTIAAQIKGENAADPRYAHFTALALGLVDSLVQEIRSTLWMLFAGAGILLLITCANVAGLVLARSIARARETAVRVALGASRRQLALHYLTEGLLVAIGGAVGGMALAALLVKWVLAIAGESIPRVEQIGLGWRSFAFSLAASSMATLLFSLAPLWQASLIAPNDALSDGVRASASAGSRRLSEVLVIGEMALAFALLAIGALVATHLYRLLHTSPGFDPENLIAFIVNADSGRYRDKDLYPYQKRLRAAIAAVPGVQSVGFANQFPLTGCCYSVLLYPDNRSTDRRGSNSASYMTIDPDYFRTMRIPILRGGGTDEIDVPDGQISRVVLDDVAARQFWPGVDALGQMAHIITPTQNPSRIIGVVGSVRNEGLGKDPRPELFFSAANAINNPMFYVVRSERPMASLLPEIRAAVRRVNPAQPIYDAHRAVDIVRDSLTAERLQSLLTGLFAAIAVLLAVLGVYSVVSYSVRNRRVEIGTRMALGAETREVLKLILADGLKMAAIGIVIGGVLVAATATFLRAHIEGIQVGDPLPYVFSILAVVLLTAAACLFPAWRATLISPMIAIRDNADSLWDAAREKARALAKRVSGIVSSTGAPRELSEADLMGEFVESSRKADSFREAIQLVVEAVKGKVESGSAMLLEKQDESFRCVASTPGECTSAVALPAGGLLAGRLRGYRGPLPFDASDVDAWRRWAGAERPDRLGEIATLDASGAALAVPLFSKQELVGIFQLGAPDGRQAYSAQEKEALRACAAQFALMLEAARLTDRLVEQEKINRDVALAVEVQKRLFPDSPPTASTVALAGRSTPARSVGGDYYDFLDLGDGRVGIALADVAGKGVSAALIMSIVQASLRILAMDKNISLADLAAKMNSQLHRSTGTSSYATFFYGVIDEAERKLRYVNAGHNPPCLLRYSASDTMEELPAGGTVIGLFPQMAYEEAAVDLRPGDVLMAFSDGVPEALNPKEEEFGEDRIKEMLRRLSHLEVNEMAKEISAELTNWIDTAAQYDDLTFILVKVKA